MFGLFSPLEKLGGAIAIILMAIIGAKLWLNNHDAEILHGYVLQSEADAIAATATEMTRQSIAASQALNDAQKRKAADDARFSAQQTATQAQVKDYETKLAAAGRSCPLSRDDISRILRDGRGPTSSRVGSPGDD